MRNLIIAVLLSVVVLSLAAVAQEQEKPRSQPAAQPAAVPLNAQQFIQNMVNQVENKNPRIRFAVREALVTMGSQATPLLQEKKAVVKNVHVKAFITRILSRLKRAAKHKGRNAIFAGFMGNRNRDIDRIAMDLNLTFEQMAKLEPVFKKYDKNVKELNAEMKESGAFGDKEAWKDLMDEMKLMAQETEPDLREFLDEKQTKGAMRYLRRSGGFGGFPMMFGDGGNIQIFQGPDGTSMGVTIKKVEKKDE